MIYSNFNKNTKLYFQFDTDSSSEWMTITEACYYIEKVDKKVNVYVSTNNNDIDSELLISDDGKVNESTFFPLINNKNVQNKIFNFIKSYTIKRNINY
jgi:hypothetical protein